MRIDNRYFTDGHIWRCNKITKEKIQKYDNTKLAANWVKNDTELDTSIENITKFIVQNIRGSKRTAYGYIWEICNENLPDEVWKLVDPKHIRNTKHIYASSKGRIRSGETTTYGNKNVRGYMMFEIFGYKYQVHRLVAFAHLSNPNNLPEVNHKNGRQKDNNCIENLEWVSSSDNVQHAHDNGLCSYRFKAIKQFDLDDNFIKEFKSIKDAAKELNCSDSGIVQVLKCNKKTAKGFKWKYA